MPKEVVWLSVYICMYIYIRSPVPRARREEREKVGSSLFHRLPRKITTRNLDLPSLPRRSRIKLPGTRTGINFVAERARVEIRAPLLNHSRKLRSERFRTKRGR